MKKNCTPGMRAVLNDVEQFMNSEQKYEDQGRPYRRGYFLHGLTGAGKSALIQLISLIYNMPIYLFNFGSKKMSDSSLVGLASSVPPNSLLVFDEFDKQRDRNPNVTDAGILSALDGPQRMSHGSVAIATSNTLDFDPDFASALFRQGRLDKQFELTEAVQF